MSSAADLSNCGIDSILGNAEQELRSLIRESKLLGKRGRVVSAVGTTIRASGLDATIGQQCVIIERRTGRRLLTDVVGLADGCVLLLPLGDLQGIATDSEVVALGSTATVSVGNALLGRVVDGLGQALDGRTMPKDLRPAPLQRAAPNPLSRKLVDQAFTSGVRVIDSMLTVGIGQRVGIFAAAGGGKSTLLGMLARQADVDVVVVALIGERGREVREFLEYSLGEAGRKKAVVVVATSDRPPIERVRAAYTAMAMAETFREQGKHVLLLMDSATRYARALREVGLSVGEPAVRQGFPPSVFAELPKLFERSGCGERGAITGFFTVLVEDEENSDPIAEEVRSILDGHIILSSKLARMAQYPAIDVLKSASRVFTAVTSADHQRAAAHIRRLMSTYEEIEFLVQVGEYKEGSSPLADEAIKKRDRIRQLFSQSENERSELDEAIAQVLELADG